KKWVESISRLISGITEDRVSRDRTGRCRRRPRRLRAVPPPAVGGVTAVEGGLHRQPLHRALPGRGGVLLVAIPPRGGEPAGGVGGVRQAAAALGGGADLRLAESVAAAEQGLRAPAGVE